LYRTALFPLSSLIACSGPAKAVLFRPLDPLPRSLFRFGEYLVIFKVNCRFSPPCFTKPFPSLCETGRTQFPALTLHRLCSHREFARAVPLYLVQVAFFFFLKITGPEDPGYLFYLTTSDFLILFILSCLEFNASPVSPPSPISKTRTGFRFRGDGPACNLYVFVWTSRSWG